VLQELTFNDWIRPFSTFSASIIFGSGDAWGDAWGQAFLIVVVGGLLFVPGTRSLASRSVCSAPGYTIPIW